MAEHAAVYPRSRRGALAVLVWAGCVVVGWGLGIASIASLTLRGWPDPHVFLLIAALVVLSELLPIVTSRRFESVSISQGFVFAALYLWGPTPAMVLMVASVLLSELIERKAIWKLLFNVGQYAISLAAACLVLSAGTTAGVGTLMGTPGEPGGSFTIASLPWIVASWLVYHLVNLALVATLAQDQDWWSAFTEDFSFYTASTLAVLALSPLVAVVAVADANSWVLLPMLMLPLLAVQRTAQMLEEREHRALHDPLTGLPNRQMLAERIETALARATGSGGRVVVVFLDLDLFKTINDGLGHRVGDAVLVDVADRLRTVLRPGDTLARFSGDEFAIVCEGIPDREIDALASRIQAALAGSFTFGSHEVNVTASIGLATATPHSTAETLLREADSAMYRAKMAGRDQVAHFHASMHEAAKGRLQDQLGLRRALERGELRAHYQPVIDLTRGTVIGMEALVRWQHPQRGLLKPDDFIPLAEETGLILPVGAWMLDESLQQLSAWRAQHPEAADLWMAVNLSPRQLTDPDLLHKINRSLSEWSVPGSALHLEITETTIMQSVDSVTPVLEALRRLGVRLIVDDFGTGYSSLARLKRLPVTALKVDRSFVEGLEMAGPAGTRNVSIVDAITNLARSMELEVIAEGVETTGQLEILQTLGATMGQGYLWSRPLPAAEVAEWLGETLGPEDIAGFRALLGG